MANAIAGLFDDKFTANDVQLLSCGTSTPDQMMPSHASMVHGLLKDSNPIPILSPSSGYVVLLPMLWNIAFYLYYLGIQIMLYVGDLNYFLHYFVQIFLRKNIR